MRILTLSVDLFLILLLGGCVWPSPAPTSFSVFYYPLEQRVCSQGVRVTVEVEPGFEISSLSYSLASGSESLALDRFAANKIQFLVEKSASSPLKEEALDTSTSIVANREGYYRGGIMTVSGKREIDYLKIAFQCGDRLPVEINLTRREYKIVAQHAFLIVVENPLEPSGLTVIARSLDPLP